MSMTAEQSEAPALTGEHQPRPAGHERVDDRGRLVEVLNEGTWRSVLTGTMKAGAIMGNHYHKHTVVYFYLLGGSAMVRTVHVESGRRDELSLRPGSGVFLPVMESHAIQFIEPSSFIMLKSRPYDPKEPDTYRFPVT